MTIPKTEDDKFQHALRTIETAWDTRISINGMKNEDSAIHYIIELSKYELLYLALSAKTGSVVSIDEWKNRNGIGEND